MDEKTLKRAFCEQLKATNKQSAALSDFKLIESTSDARTLADLVGAQTFNVIEDTSAWNPYPDQMIDIIGGMVPDVVLQSNGSKENRMYIEVKLKQPLNYGKADSQILRYFLHLLATTRRNPPGCPSDIGRAVILAAPSDWFTHPENAGAWSYFKQTYRDLASAFGVTIAEIHLDQFLA